jgi:hypothetical protein
MTRARPPPDPPTTDGRCSPHGSTLDPSLDHISRRMSCQPSAIDTRQLGTAFGTTALWRRRHGRCATLQRPRPHPGWAPRPLRARPGGPFPRRGRARDDPRHTLKEGQGKPHDQDVAGGLVRRGSSARCSAPIDEHGAAGSQRASAELGDGGVSAAAAGQQHQRQRQIAGVALETGEVLPWSGEQHGRCVLGGEPALDDHGYAEAIRLRGRGGIIPPTLRHGPDAPDPSAPAQPSQPGET